MTKERKNKKKGGDWKEVGKVLLCVLGVRGGGDEGGDWNCQVASM